MECNGWPWVAHALGFHIQFFNLVSNAHSQASLAKSATHTIPANCWVGRNCAGRRTPVSVGTPKNLSWGVTRYTWSRSGGSGAAQMK